MPKIKEIYAREILDSRGYPTIEASVLLTDNTVMHSAAPSGVSKGTYEAVELRDNDPKRYQGMGVSNAVKNVNEMIGPKIVGMDVLEQQKIDRAMIELDGTPNKSKVGANATISVSQAIVKAGAKVSLLPTALYIKQLLSEKVENKMPIPMFNVLEGGKHGGSGGLGFQEFLVIPASSKTFSEGLELGVNVYQAARKLIQENSKSTLTADEGGFSPDLSNNQEGFSYVKQAVERAGYSFSLDAFMGLDAAATAFQDKNVYKLADKAIPYSADELVQFYSGLVSDYSLVYLEDSFGEEDWEGWKKVHSALASKTIVCGDDLTTTNPYRLQLALDRNTINGIVIKPNQIGTVTEAIAVVEIARFKGLKIIASHRGGETVDSFIADFAVGIGADYIKAGAPARERISKYNKLLEIEYELSKL